MLGLKYDLSFIEFTFWRGRQRKSEQRQEKETVMRSEGRVFQAEGLWKAKIMKSEIKEVEF